MLAREWMTSQTGYGSCSPTRIRAASARSSRSSMNSATRSLVVARLLKRQGRRRREHLDVAIVGLGEESGRALVLISEFVKNSCMPSDRRHCRRRPRVYHLSTTPPNAASRLRQARIHGALGRRALVEQARGILMERHGISADDAFASLRERSRNTNTTRPRRRGCGHHQP